MVQFDLPPYRPPSEARSLLIRATRGCPWNKCAFCSMYKNKKFELRSVEEIEQDILAMKELSEAVKDWAWKMGYGDRVEQIAIYNGIFWLDNDGAVRRAFIGDSNSIIMKTEDFVHIIEFLYHSFPTLERVTSYGRAHTIRRKQLEELKRWKEAGLSRLHVGLETGDDELLAYVNKGATSEQMIEAGRKVNESGISLCEYVILGLGGPDRWQQHAEATARVLSAINPDFIRVRTLRLEPGTPLYEKHQQGEFKLSSPEEVLREERRLIENLEVSSEFVSDHVTNYLNINGKLPQDKERMLDYIDTVLAAPPELRGNMLQPEELRHL
jgi:radical SAM superfamily enzyme YgiQ (UPF0313 family)